MVKLLRLGDFDPHPADLDALDALTGLSPSFRLTPTGRVWSVYVGSWINDDHVSSIMSLPTMIEFNVLHIEGVPCMFTHDGVCSLLKHPSLQGLLIQNSTLLSDDTFAEIGRSSRIRWLKVPNCGVTNEGVRGIAQATQLLGLSISSNPVTERCLKYLQHLKELRHLWIQDTEIRFSERTRNDVDQYLKGCVVHV